MKKRILSILLLCCMVLTLLPTAAFAAGELPDVKLSVPTTFDKTVDLTEQNGELKIKDSKTYLIKGSADPNWYFQHRIKIDGKNNTPHIFLDGVRLQAPKDGPAIELYGGASACLYFIGGDSELVGAETSRHLTPLEIKGDTLVISAANQTYLFVFQQPQMREPILRNLSDFTNGRIQKCRFVSPGRR